MSDKRDTLKAELYDSLTRIIKEGVQVLVKDSEGDRLETIPAGAPYYQAAIALMRADAEEGKAPQAETLSTVMRRMQKKSSLNGPGTSTQQ